MTFTYQFRHSVILKAKYLYDLFRKQITRKQHSINIIKYITLYTYDGIISNVYRWEGVSDGSKTPPTEMTVKLYNNVVV